MNTTAMFIAGLVMLPAVGLVTWAWFAMARVEDEFRAAASKMPVMPAFTGLA